MLPSFGDAEFDFLDSKYFLKGSDVFIDHGLLNLIRVGKEVSRIEYFLWELQKLVSHSKWFCF